MSISMGNAKGRKLAPKGAFAFFSLYAGAIPGHFSYAPAVTLGPVFNRKDGWSMRPHPSFLLLQFNVDIRTDIIEEFRTPETALVRTIFYFDKIHIVAACSHFLIKLQRTLIRDKFVRVAI